jgi:hypothetical protein
MGRVVQRHDLHCILPPFPQKGEDFVLTTFRSVGVLAGLAAYAGLLVWHCHEPGLWPLYALLLLYLTTELATLAPRKH